MSGLIIGFSGSKLTWTDCCANWLWCGGYCVMTSFSCSGEFSLTCVGCVAVSCDRVECEVLVVIL